jgi:hypothetical protein
MIKKISFNAKSGRNNIVPAYSITYSISLSCMDMDMAYGIAPYGLSYSIRLWIEALSKAIERQIIPSGYISHM